MQHPNVVSFRDSFIDSATQTICLVMEYCEEGDLLARIDHHRKHKTNFSEQELWSFLI